MVAEEKKKKKTKLNRGWHLGELAFREGPAPGLQRPVGMDGAAVSFKPVWKRLYLCSPRELLSLKCRKRI